MNRVFVGALFYAVAANGLAQTSVPVDEVETVEVTGNKAADSMTVDAQFSASPDSGDLLKQVPGADINKNGALTGIAQYRGMYGDRVNVKINNASLTGGGPNAMDTPLHYSPSALTQSIMVIRGISPVSSGQQTIGGTVKAETVKGEFSNDENWGVTGFIDVGGSSAAKANYGAVNVVVADDQQKIRASVLTESGDDYKYPEGKVSSTEYERSREELSYAFRSNGHTISFTGINNETGKSGTPALPMDIIYVDTVIGQIDYGFEGDNYSLISSLVYNDAEHVMDNFQMRSAPMNPMMYRSTLAVGSGTDFSLMSQWGATGSVWRVGTDWHKEEHDADVTNPNNANFLVVNFNEVESSILGIFVETEQALNPRTQLHAGLRVNQVDYDAGEVSATVMPSMQMMANMLAAKFNAADRKQSDTNIDAVLKTYYQTTQNLNLYAGIAHKTRSASYQERYLWMPMEATGGLADMRNYIGNVDLNPEKAKEVELGFEFEQQSLMFSPRVFYRDIKDYIQGTPSSLMTPTVTLQFNNVEAKIYGFDMPWHWAMTQQFLLRGGFSAVRGERKDIDDNLYRISPDNASMALDYSLSHLLTGVELVGYAKQNRVSKTNTEQKTSGYGVVNLYASYGFMKDTLKLSAGVDNVLDKHYLNHLGGYNRVTNSDVAKGERLPGMGRNAFAKLVWSF